MVIAADFAIATAILLVYIRFFSKLVPLFFHAQPRMTIIVAIFAMMVAQYLSSTIIHLRQVTFEQFYTGLSAWQPFTQHASFSASG